MSGLKLFELGSLNITTGGSSARVAGLTEVGTSIVKANDDSTGLTLDSGSSIFLNAGVNGNMIITPGGSVGIGTSNPSERLEVYPNTDNSAIIGNAHLGFMGWEGNTVVGFSYYGKNDKNNYALLQDSSGITVLNASSGGYMSFRINGNYNPDIMRLTSGPCVAIAKNDPSYTLDVNGTTACTSGTWSSSDDRIKYNEKIISGVSALAIVNQLEPQYYEKITQIPNGVSGNWIPTDAEWPSVKGNYVWGNEAGLIAQDIRAIPELSFTVEGNEVDAEGTQIPLYLNYNDIYAYHIAATKELSNQLNAKTVTLETQVADLITRVTQLENP